MLRAKQANAEQLELEQVHKLTASRRISADQHERIVKALRGHPIAVILLSPGDDREAAQFADDLGNELTEAGSRSTRRRAFYPFD